MYAVIAVGGKQVRVREGDRVRVEKIEAPIGASVTLDQVLLVGEAPAAIQIGTPTVEGVSVEATVMAQERAAKVRTFKKKRRKGFSKRRNHRQYYTELQVTAIRGAATAAA